MNLVMFHSEEVMAQMRYLYLPTRINKVKYGVLVTHNSA